jgi:hypothetical protein
LGTKWTDVSRDCNKFTGVLSRIKELHVSGTTDAEEEEATLVQYQKEDDDGKAFAYMGCWRIVKDSAKWKLACELQEKVVERINMRKKSRTVVRASLESTQVDQSFKEITNERPIGRKRAKQIVGLEARALKSKNKLAESNNNIAAAIDRKARALEGILSYQYVNCKLQDLDQDVQKYVSDQRQLAKLRLSNQLAQANQENIGLGMDSPEDSEAELKGDTQEFNVTGEDIVRESNAF